MNRSQPPLAHEVGDVVIADATNPRSGLQRGLQSGDGSDDSLGRVGMVGDQIGHRLAPHGDGEALALLHGSRQARSLGLGPEGADASMTVLNFAVACKAKAVLVSRLVRTVV